MSKSAQLKRKAAEFEQKRQYDRALATYTQAIEASAGIPDELDIPLYNRVGDLHLRLGDMDKAISYYEAAVDLYAEGGFFNNAMALCNKVLRHAPNRAVIYYKLGKISARKGFNSDAKQNFLEYASRMERSGDVSEAFRALKEFADLCPGQDDVRLMLAEQLARAGRTQEALEQLQIVHETMTAEGRTTEANATLERIRVLDPSFQPSTERSSRQQKREGLVFLDVDDFDNLALPQADTAPRIIEQPPVPAAPEPPVLTAPEHVMPEPAPMESAPIVAQPMSAEKFGEVTLPREAEPRIAKTFDGSPLAGLTPLDDPMQLLAEEAAANETELTDVEPTSLESEELSSPVQSMDVEHTSLDMQAPAPPATGLKDAVTSYVESLSADIGIAEGGLPGDIGILPPEALNEEQHVAVPPTTPPAGAPDEEFVDLNDWLLETEPVRNPRMTADDASAADGTIETDFSQMLDTFKAGVAANVDAGDADSHYDLGVAYMEMGLLDDAISQFQVAIRAGGSPERRVRAYESLGQSFIEQGRHDLAIESLRGALSESGLPDSKLVGVLYLLGYSSEQLSRWREAEEYYRRVFTIDTHFRDIGDRVKRAEQMP